MVTQDLYDSPVKVLGKMIKESSAATPGSPSDVSLSLREDDDEKKQDIFLVVSLKEKFATRKFEVKLSLKETNAIQRLELLLEKALDRLDALEQAQCQCQCQSQSQKRKDLPKSTAEALAMIVKNESESESDEQEAPPKKEEKEKEKSKHVPPTKTIKKESKPRSVQRGKKSDIPAGFMMTFDTGGAGGKATGKKGASGQGHTGPNLIFGNDGMRLLFNQ